MGRLHSKGKGISASALPYSRAPPAWLKTTPDQVVEQICKLARKGATPSQIGVILRDSHGVAQVKIVTGTFSPTRAIELRGNTMLTLALQVTAFSASSRPTVRFPE
jgi:small subunit ribosomal protein S13e